MKSFFTVAAITAMLAGCGYTSRDNELIGQPKKVMLNTPLICPDYYDVDVSLGVMRGGVGSMSTEDVWLRIPADAVKDLKKAVEDGAVIKVHYDVKRFTLCTSDHFLTGFEVIK